MTEEYRLVKDSVYDYIQVSIKPVAIWLKSKYIWCGDECINLKGYLISLKQQFRTIYMVALFPRPRYPLFIVGWENPTNKYIEHS